MKLVVIESPFAGATPELAERNLRYLRACMRDCLLRGESPLASHLLYTQPGVLDDTKPAERELGIAAGFAWRARADATVIYTDRGISGGMQKGIAHAHKMRAFDMQAAIDPERAHAIEFRQLGGEWSKP